eukprot:s2560_g6.t1
MHTAAAAICHAPASREFAKPWLENKDVKSFLDPSSSRYLVSLKNCAVGCLAQAQVEHTKISEARLLTMLTEPVTSVVTGPTGPAPASVASTVQPVSTGPYRLVSGTPYRVAAPQPGVTYSYPGGPGGYTVPYQISGSPARVVAAPVAAQTSLPVSSAAVSTTKSEMAPVATLPPLQSAQAMPIPQTIPGPPQVSTSVVTAPPMMTAAGGTPTSVLAAPCQSVRSPVSAVPYSLPVQVSPATPVADPGPMLAEMDAAGPGTSHEVQSSTPAQPNFHVPEAGSQAKKQKKKGKSKKCACCQ